MHTCCRRQRCKSTHVAAPAANIRTKHRMYRPGPYYAAKLTATLPFNLLIAILFCWTGYGMFGYRNTALALVQVGVGRGAGVLCGG